MPRAFMITHRRYLPTPLPPPCKDDDNNNNSSPDDHEVQMEVRILEQRHHDHYHHQQQQHQRLFRLPQPFPEEEQLEAVDLVVHKDSNKWTSNKIHNFLPFDSGATSNAANNNNNNNNNCYYYKDALSTTGELPASSVYSSVYGDVSYISPSHDSGADKNCPEDGCSGIVDSHISETGIDLSMKGEYLRRQPTPVHCQQTPVHCQPTPVHCQPTPVHCQPTPVHRQPTPVHRTAAEAELHDKSGLSDGDSDSGCSTQNEGRGHLPPEVEYGWAECHAHFSLLYDLMTQSARKTSAGSKEGSEAGSGYLVKESSGDPAPHDYSKTSPTRDAHEPPVLYELMAESPRKASGRDVPEHALEVEVPMQHYQPPQHMEGQRMTMLEMADESGVAGSGTRYEARRSLNDLLYAAGLPPASPLSSPPSPSSSSPVASPRSSSAPEEAHTCDDCGKRYSTSSNLARHRQTHRSHGDKKARKCPHCDKVYVSMPAFSMHVRTHNQGCACPHCGKRFSRPWLLQGHIRTHTGEKPFACPQCGKSFADKSNLRAHIQTHSSEKPYVCGRCGKAFALKSYLYKHEESSCMRGERFRPLRKVASEY